MAIIYVKLSKVTLYFVGIIDGEYDFDTSESKALIMQDEEAESLADEMCKYTRFNSIVVEIIG